MSLSKYSFERLVLMLVTGLPMLIVGGITLHGQSSITDRSPTGTLRGKIESFTDFKGRWACAGSFRSSGKHIESKMVFAPDLDGRWL